MTTPSDEPRTRRPRRPRRPAKDWPDTAPDVVRDTLVRERIDDLHESVEDLREAVEDLCDLVERGTKRRPWSMGQIAAAGTLVATTLGGIATIVSAVTGHSVATPAVADAPPEFEAPTDAADAPEPTP